MSGRRAARRTALFLLPFSARAQHDPAEAKFKHAANAIPNKYIVVLNDDVKCFEVYLRRAVSSTDGGFQFWLNDLNSYGNPANQNGIIHLTTLSRVQSSTASASVNRRNAHIYK